MQLPQREERRSLVSPTVSSCSQWVGYCSPACLLSCSHWQLQRYSSLPFIFNGKPAARRCKDTSHVCSGYKATKLAGFNFSYKYAVCCLVSFVSDSENAASHSVTHRAVALSIVASRLSALLNAFLPFSTGVLAQKLNKVGKCRASASVLVDKENSLWVWKYLMLQNSANE